MDASGQSSTSLAPVSEGSGTRETIGSARGDPGLDKTLRSFADLSYRDAFWPTRRYEDACDRIALRGLLPPTGERLIDVGGGFGRLASEYGGYREVVLLDPSAAMLDAARQQLGADGRFSFVAGDAFCLPFPDKSFDAVVSVRVMHQFEDPRPAIQEFARVLRPGGTLVLESVNKRDLKAIVAYLIGRQAQSPFGVGSQHYENVYLLPRRALPSLHQRGAAPALPSSPSPQWPAGAVIAHAPRDLRRWLRAAGLDVVAARSVGLFRLQGVTRHVPLPLLVGLERVQQRALASLTLGPSLFLAAVSRPDPPDVSLATEGET